MAQSQTVLWDEDFNTEAPGSAWSANVIVQSAGGNNNSRCVRANYNLVQGPNGSGSNRMVTNRKFYNAQQSSNCTLSYDVFFEADWTNTIGGKFLGIGPENFVTGGRNLTPDGWSARVVMDDRVPHLYIYDQDKNWQYGRKIAPVDLTPLSKSAWHSISLWVRLNTGVAANDGLVELWVDGVLRVSFPNARLRETLAPVSTANTMLFHTFLGGTDTGTPNGTQHVKFDSIIVQGGKVIRP